MTRSLRATSAALAAAFGLALAGPALADSAPVEALPVEDALPGGAGDPLLVGDDLTWRLLDYRRRCTDDERSLETLVCVSLRKDLTFGPPPTIADGWK